MSLRVCLFRTFVPSNVSPLHVYAPSVCISLCMFVPSCVFFFCVDVPPCVCSFKRISPLCLFLSVCLVLHVYCISPQCMCLSVCISPPSVNPIMCIYHRVCLSACISLCVSPHVYVPYLYMSTPCVSPTVFSYDLVNVPPC